MKNFIIGYGEALTSEVSVKSGPGDKKHPYSFSEARDRLVSNLTGVMEEIESKPYNQCANGEFVIKFIQHPSFLAKSYYPNKFFKKFGVKDVGSKAIRVKPLKWAIAKHPDEGLASCIFVAGEKTAFEAMLNSVEHDELPETTKTLIRTFEKISTVDASEKIKKIVRDDSGLKLEVVLHANKQDDFVRSSFTEYTEYLGGQADWERAKIVGGLTFLPVNISDGSELKLAEFSHLRALRSIPKLRFKKYSKAKI
jgi:hypothetical protein